MYMPNMTEGTLTPAYGRDYKTIDKLRKDWLDGKDFIFNTYTGTTYCSIRDAIPGSTIKFRFDKKRKTGFLKVEVSNE